MKQVAVVILNWNGQAMLERFLPKVVKYSHQQRFAFFGTEFESRVVVADNGSTDGSVELLQREFPEVELLQFDHNYGFAEGYNRALCEVEADYYVLLNSDVECTPHWLEPAMRMMEPNPDIAVVQPKLLMHDRHDTFEYSGGAGGFIDSYGYPFCRGRLFSTLEQDHGQYDNDCELFWASGAAMIVRAAVWHEVGGLDSDFFAHMEEIDFCWRVHLKGYRVSYCAGAKLYHVGGGTLPKSNPLKTKLNFRNNLSMLYKNLPEGRRERVIGIRMVLDWLAAVKFLAEGHLGEFKAVKEAHREFRAWKPQLDRKRALMDIKPVAKIYQGKLLIEYYLLHRHTYTDLRGTYSKAGSKKSR
ncbi:MAG: glycosyltransferase family 2 protein [Bacteroidales bacterium]|nr:glycosyltransferase family 2 protein [Bacteroidales bacterium]